MPSIKLLFANKFFWVFVSFVLFALVIFGLITQEMVAPDVLRASLDWQLFVFAGLCFSAIYFGMALRWYWSARFLRVELHLTKTIFLFPFSNLGALTLIGPIGGDFVRFAMLKASSSQPSGALFSTIFMDRMLSLLGMAGGIYILLVFYSIASSYYTALLVLICIGALGICAVLGAWFYLKRIAERKLKVTAGILYQIFHYSDQLSLQAFMRLMGLVVFSVILTIATALATALIVRQIGILDLSFLDGALAAIAGNAASSIPLTPGGVGLGEAGYQEAVAHMTASREGASATPYFIFRMLNLMTSLCLMSVFIIVWLAQRWRLKYAS